MTTNSFNLYNLNSYKNYCLGDGQMRTEVSGEQRARWGRGALSSALSTPGAELYPYKDEGPILSSLSQRQAG